MTFSLPEECQANLALIEGDFIDGVKLGHKTIVLYLLHIFLVKVEYDGLQTKLYERSSFKLSQIMRCIVYRCFAREQAVRLNRYCIIQVDELSEESIVLVPACLRASSV